MVKLLTIHIGAEIHGVDLTIPFSSLEITSIRTALLSWKVIYSPQSIPDSRAKYRIFAGICLDKEYEMSMQSHLRRPGKMAMSPARSPPVGSERKYATRGRMIGSPDGRRHSID